MLTVATSSLASLCLKLLLAAWTHTRCPSTTTGYVTAAANGRFPIAVSFRACSTMNLIQLCTAISACCASVQSNVLMKSNSWSLASSMLSMTCTRDKSAKKLAHFCHATASYASITRIHKLLCRASWSTLWYKGGSCIGLLIWSSATHLLI